MATSRKTGGLNSLSTARLASMVSVITGERVKKYKDKNTAIKAMGKPSKQALVLALLKTGGASVGEIAEMFSIRRAYARDIISKLTIKGHKIEKDGLAGDGDHLFVVAA